MTNFIYVANIQVFRQDNGIYITDCYTTITEKRQTFQNWVEGLKLLPSSFSS